MFHNFELIKRFDNPINMTNAFDVVNTDSSSLAEIK